MSGTINNSLTRYAWISIAAAVVTITLKMTAWRLTDSVGLLSDALESVVNLVAAVIALIALSVAAREPDEEHAYGHGKAEYLSSAVEGTLIFFAALAIFSTAIPRLLHPAPLMDTRIGLMVAAVASVVNGLVGWYLLRAGRQFRSITLESSARHLFTDVWTSVGVITAVILVGFTGWDRLDPIIAIAIGLNIVIVGVRLVNRSVHGLLDTAIPAKDMRIVDEILSRYEREEGVHMHAIRTREAGRRRFVSMHVLVPGNWSVARGHELVGRLEADIRAALPESTIFTHLEPLEDASSWNDDSLDG